MNRTETNLVEGINYIRDPQNNKILWRKMIPLEYLYPNPSRKDVIEKKYGKSYKEIKPEEITDDIDLCVTIGGIRTLLDLKGFRSVKRTVDFSSLDLVVITCEIVFLPSDGECEQTYSSNASAHLGNSNGFMQKYLVECCSNRAFCRCVREALNIGIVSREELFSETTEQKDEPFNHSLSPTQSFKNLLKTKGYTFEQIKKKMVMDGDKDASSYEKPEDVPPSKIRKIIEKLKEIRVV